MFLFIIGFILGTFSIPLIYIILPFIMVEVGQIKYLKIRSEHKKRCLTDSQAKEILNALHKTTDLYWLNAIIQRMYVEMQDSFVNQHRMKNSIEKKFLPLLKSGYIKNVEIKGIEMGHEGPYIKDIQLLSYKEYKDLTSQRNIKDVLSDDDTLVKLERAVENDFGVDMEFFKNNENFSKLKEKINERDGNNITSPNNAESIDKSPKSKADLNIKQKNKYSYSDKEELISDVFENMIFLSTIKYEGGIKITLKVELPKNIEILTTVFLNGLNGNLLIRLPAKGYDTRVEYCFLQMPDILITLESGILDKTGKLHFRKSISGILERYIKRALIKTLVYPYWSFQYLTMVIPSFRDIKHYIERITADNFEEKVTKIKELILLYMSMDYKIVKIEGNIFYRRINYFINGEEDRIHCSHFVLPKISLSTSHFNSGCLAFDNLTVQESKIMSQIHSWEIFYNVFSDFKELRVKAYLNRQVSIVGINFNEVSFEFVRIVSGNVIIFQRNCGDFPDFIAFKIADQKLFIYQYFTNSRYEFNSNRVNKLYKKLEQKPFTSLGSTNLYKVLKFGRKAAMKYLKSEHSHDEQTNYEPPETKACEIKAELIDIFKEIKDSFEIKDFNTRKIYSKSTPEHLYRALSQDTVRIKLFSENCEVYTIMAESDNIRSYIVEKTCKEFKGEDDSNECVKSYPEGFTLHSYFEQNLIIDLRLDDQDIVFIHKVEPVEDLPDYKSMIILFYPKIMNIEFPNYFIESLQLRSRQSEYLKYCEQIPFSTSIVSPKFTKTVAVGKCALYMEFKAPQCDDFNFKIYLNGELIYDIYKVIMSRSAKIIYPFDVEGEVKITITPKFNRNRTVDYKIFSLPENFSKEMLVDCNIGLSKGMKFYLPILGDTNHIIFWEKTYDKEIKGYIEDDINRIAIGGNGALRTDNKDYYLCYKNKGEKKRDIKIYVGLCYRKV